MRYALFTLLVACIVCSSLSAECPLPYKERCAFEELVYVREYNIQTDCSTKAKNILHKKLNAYAQEIARCEFEPTPTPTATATPTPDPFLPVIRKWEQRISASVDWHYANYYPSGSSAYNDEHYNIIYYDGLYAFKQLETYFNDRGKTDTALKAGGISRRMEADYHDLLHMYRTRSQWHFARSAALVNDDLLIYSGENPTWGCDACIDEALAPNQLDIRGLAYQLGVLALLKRKQIDVVVNHDLEELAIRLSAYTEGYPHNWNLFYMDALLGHMLIDYKAELEPTIMPLAAANRIAAFIKPFVEANGRIKYGSGNHSEAEAQYPELNLIIAPFFYKLGDKETAEKLFKYGVDTANYGEGHDFSDNFNFKVVPQNIVYAIDMIEGY